MDEHILTPRLLLTRLTNPRFNSDHCKWYHELCSDEDVMAWNLSNPHTYVEESQFSYQRMLASDKIYYAVHARKTPTQHASADEVSNSHDYDSLRGQLLGTVSLRWQDPEPNFPPPPRPSALDSSLTPTTDTELLIEKPFIYRVLGYAVRKSAWGKGYATEANSAFLSAYGKYLSNRGEPGYVEAHLDIANVASERVVQKLGFCKMGSKKYSEYTEALQLLAGKGKLGWREEEGEEGEEGEKRKTLLLWMGGAWRDDGFFAYGLWVS